MRSNFGALYKRESPNQQHYATISTEKLKTKRGNLTASYGFSTSSQSKLDEETGVFIPHLNKGTRAIFFQSLTKLFEKGTSPDERPDLNSPKAMFRHAEFARDIGDNIIFEGMSIGMTGDLLELVS